MRFPFARCLWIALLFAPAVGALFGGMGQDKETDAITLLVKQLANREYVKRESAARKIIAFGEPALPALQNAVWTAKDLETRRRARQLILTILPTSRKSKSTGMKLVRVKPGTFDMGSSTTERNRRTDETQHSVRISMPYFIGVYEVTQGDYQKVMGINPSWFSEKGEGKGKLAGINTSTFPVENITWFDAIDFCNRLSKKDDLAPYYALTDVVRVKGAIAKAKVKIVGGNGYRLPTEAEWEVACRDWTMTAFHFGASVNGRLANLQPAPGAGGYGGAPTWKPLNRTASVGSYAPNSRGLYDMHGNVEEWCWDWYDKDYYENSPRGDPSGPAKGTHKVVRGGSWIVNERSSRTASRFWRRPGEFAYFGGFRVARSP